MTSDDQAHFDRFAKRRDALPLPKGLRWLTTDDHWQLGDEYLASAEWWAVGGRHTRAMPGDPVPRDVMCYTPRGSTKRERTR